MRNSKAKLSNNFEALSFLRVRRHAAAEHKPFSDTRLTQFRPDWLKFGTERVPDE
jgi:hypothetical protein